MGIASAPPILRQAASLTNPTQTKTPPGIGRRLNSIVQRMLNAILHENPKNSIPETRIDTIEFAQQRRPYQGGRAQLHPLGIFEQRSVLVDHGLFDRIG